MDLWKEFSQTHGVATMLEMSMFDSPSPQFGLSGIPPPSPPPRPLPSTFCPHMSRSRVSRWPNVLGDGGVTASRLPQNVGTLLHLDPMEVVSVRALLFLSAATTWCGPAEQEEDPLEGLGHEDKIRDALVSCLQTQSAASCLPVGALTFSGLRFLKKTPPAGAKTLSKFYIYIFFIIYLSFPPSRPNLKSGDGEPDRLGSRR